MMLGRGCLPVALLVLAFSPVWADTPPPVVKKATPDELSRYRAALKQGQALEAKGDHTGAIAAFNRALAVFPDDPTVLDEMATASYKAKDLATAETLARRAAARSPNAKLRGRILYNLGRVQEARGEKDKAIESYKRSLDDRPNRIVRERLATLDPAAAVEKDRVAPTAMAGPFSSIRQWCARSETKKNCDAADDDGDGSPDNQEGQEKPQFSCDDKGPALAKPPAPFRAARVVVARCDYQNNQELVVDEVVLALRVGDQWFIGDVTDALNNLRQSQSFETKLEARPLVAGSPPRVLVHLTTSLMYRGMDGTEDESLLIAGVGASGKPSLTRPILESSFSDEDDQETGENRGRHGGKLKLDFQPGEMLEITGPTKKAGTGIDKDTLAPLLGKHQLVFP
jgi:tetratricopeptide (TPR) repeat protein